MGHRADHCRPPPAPANDPGTRPPGGRRVGAADRHREGRTHPDRRRRPRPGPPRERTGRREDPARAPGPVRHDRVVPADRGAGLGRAHVRQPGARRRRCRFRQDVGDGGPGRLRSAARPGRPGSHPAAGVQQGRRDRAGRPAHRSLRSCRAPLGRGARHHLPRVRPRRHRPRHRSPPERGPVGRRRQGPADGHPSSSTSSVRPTPASHSRGTCSAPCTPGSATIGPRSRPPTGGTAPNARPGCRPTAGRWSAARASG